MKAREFEADINEAIQKEGQAEVVEALNSTVEMFQSSKLLVDMLGSMDLPTVVKNEAEDIQGKLQKIMKVLKKG